MNEQRITLRDREATYVGAFDVLARPSLAPIRFEIRALREPTKSLEKFEGSCRLMALLVGLPPAPLT